MNEYNKRGSQPIRSVGRSGAHNSKEVHNHHSTKTQKAQSKKSHQAIDQQIEHPPDRIPGRWCLHDSRDCDLHREAGRRT